MDRKQINEVNFLLSYYGVLKKDLIGFLLKKLKESNPEIKNMLESLPPPKNYIEY